MKIKMTNFKTRTNIEKPDLLVHPEGTVILFTPITDVARQWIYDHVADDWQWFGPALVIDHRYANDLFERMAHAGLSFGGVPSEQGH